MIHFLDMMDDESHVAPQDAVARVKALGDELGLEVERADALSLRGTIDDHQVTLTAMNGHPAKCCVTPKTSLPSRILVRAETLIDRFQGLFTGGDPKVGDWMVDDALWFGAPHGPTVQALFGQEALRGCLRSCVRSEVDIVIAHGQVVVTGADMYLDAARLATQHALAVAKALTPAWEDSWRQFGEEHGLSYEPPNRLTGEIRGRRVALEFDEMAFQTTASTPLDHAFTGSLTGTAKGGLDLADPVLDGQIAADFPADGVQERICRDEVRGPLLSILRGRPLSRVGPALVVAIEPGRVFEPGALLSDLVDLAEVL